eukprot:TRINITY_DN14573_c0_g2_i4.p1 TRINITY_DN14573_c0_g2~~TRINITY_DN14573_c0_g2_i4.p1  ORF type:complete len:478 (-),score=170.20 TRINITY_DN14573_c0_g2_i4:88-1521(-)
MKAINSRSRINFKVASKEELMNFLAPFAKMERIEEDIRRSQLREIDRRKEELQQRLVLLNKNAEALREASKNSMAKFSMLKPSRSLNKLSFEQSFAEQKCKERIARAFIMRIRRKQNARREKLKQRVKKELELQQRREEERIKNIKDAESKARAERLSRLLNNSELNRQKCKEQKEKLREQQNAFRFPSTYLHSKLEEKYKTEVVLPKLEEEKMIKEKRHEIFKSLSKEELHAHQGNVKNYKIQHEEKKILEMQEGKAKAAEFKETLKKYNSTLRMRVKRLEEQKARENSKKALEKRNMRAKMLSYSSIVKKKHPVSVSKEKAIELRQLMEQQRHPVKQRRNVKDLYDPIKLNREYRALRHKSTDHKSSLASKELGNLPGTEASSKQQNKNYLAEARLKRQGILKTLKAFNCNLSMDVNKESSLEKIEDRIKLIEQQARLNERLLNIKTKEDIDANEYISNIFVHTIKAKIALLESM